jgi:uncharacterized membrane protein
MHFAQLAASWGSFYANHAAVRSAVAFVHLAALIIGGGIAIAADRATLVALRQRDEHRRLQLDALHATHRTVVAALLLVGISGVLLFGADLDTYLYSRFFWIKMGLVALLVVNGLWLWRAEGRARLGDRAAWGPLRLTSMASIALWLLTTLGGAILPNVG